MAIKKLFYDLETTGTNHMKHSIHEASFMMEIDGEIVETFELKFKPHPKGQIDPEALAVCNITLDQLNEYPDQAISYNKLIQFLDKYVDRYDKTDKIILVGYNSLGFDNKFLRMLFLLNDNQYFGSYFFSGGIDVLSMALEYLTDRRAQMPSFKLSSVAEELGMQIEESSLHGSSYDILITREVYRIVTGREIEI